MFSHFYIVLQGDLLARNESSAAGERSELQARFLFVSFRQDICIHFMYMSTSVNVSAMPLLR
jgi:hypothetical protein